MAELDLAQDIQRRDRPALRALGLGTQFDDVIDPVLASYISLDQNWAPKSMSMSLAQKQSAIDIE